MRRKDREVTDRIKIREVLQDCHCCRIGFVDQGQSYIVPMNFGYRWDKELPVLYFHSAKEGRKIDLIGENPRVGFEMDTSYEFHRGELACQCSAAFRSVIGSGAITVVEDPQEKLEGFLTIMEHYSGSRAWRFDEKMLSSACVLKLRVTELSCKEHQ